MATLALVLPIPAQATPGPYDAAAEIFLAEGFRSWQVPVDSDVTARLRAAMRERESRCAS